MHKGCDSNRGFLDRKLTIDSTIFFHLVNLSQSFHVNIQVDKKVWDEMMKLLEGRPNMIVRQFQLFLQSYNPKLLSICQSPTNFGKYANSDGYKHNCSHIMMLMHSFSLQSKLWSTTDFHFDFLRESCFLFLQFHASEQGLQLNCKNGMP